jgi:hypothetical protein
MFILNAETPANKSHQTVGRNYSNFLKYQQVTDIFPVTTKLPAQPYRLSKTQALKILELDFIRIFFKINVNLG